MPNKPETEVSDTKEPSEAAIRHTAETADLVSSLPHARALSWWALSHDAFAAQARADERAKAEAEHRNVLIRLRSAIMQVLDCGYMDAGVCSSCRMLAQDALATRQAKEVSDG